MMTKGEYGKFVRDLRTARKAAGLTQKQLGNKCGLSDSYVGVVESGSCPPSEKAAKKLLAALNGSGSLPSEMIAGRLWPRNWPWPQVGETNPVASGLGPVANKPEGATLTGYTPPTLLTNGSYTLTIPGFVLQEAIIALLAKARY